MYQAQRNVDDGQTSGIGEEGKAVALTDASLVSLMLSQSVVSQVQLHSCDVM